MARVTITDTRTYQTMQNRIVSDLKRSSANFTLSIQEAIGDAIYFYQQKKFFFNENTDSQTVTSKGVNLYTPPDDLIEIIELTITISSVGLVLPLTRRPIEWILARDVNSPSTQGQPTDYAFFNDQVRLFVTPDAGAGGNNYTLNYYYQSVIPPPVNPTDAGFWMTTGEQMIRAYAEGVLYAQVLNNPQKAKGLFDLSESFYLSLSSQNAAALFTGRTKATKF